MQSPLGNRTIDASSCLQPPSAALIAMVATAWSGYSLFFPIHLPYSAMPDALKSGPESGAENPVFLEGPSFDRQGNLYCVDIYNSHILRITPDRQWSIAARYDGHPNGLKIRRDGQIFITDRRLDSR